MKHHLTRRALDRVERLMDELAGPGPLGDIVREHLETGGKRTRALLALEAARGLAGVDGTAWAAACELLHNATLVHDDVQDGDRMRRDRPTTWAAHGLPQAINAGDLLLMLPTLALAHQEASPAQRFALSHALASRAVDCVKGQALELSLPAQARWSFEDWAQAARGKSGALLALPIEGAAILAGLPDARALGDHFAEAGVLYQLVDDLVDLYGDKGRGTPGCDLREGKVSAVVTRHLELAPEDEPWLRALLARSREETTELDVARATRSFHESGAVESLLDEIEDRADRLVEAELPPALLPIARALAERCTRPVRSLRAPARGSGARAQARQSA